MGCRRFRADPLRPPSHSRNSPIRTDFRHHPSIPLSCGLGGHEAHSLVLPVLVFGDHVPIFRSGASSMGFVAGNRRAHRIRTESGCQPKRPEKRTVDRLSSLPVPVLRLELFRTDQGQGILSAVPARLETAHHRQRRVPRIRCAFIRLPPAFAPTPCDRRKPGLNPQTPASARPRMRAVSKS